MIYPADIEKKLGFDKIRIMLKEKCLSAPAVERVDKIQFSQNAEQLKLWLSQTWEFLRLLESGEGFPSAYFFDVRLALKRSQTAGSFLDAEDMLAIRQSLETILEMLSFIGKRKEEYPYLYQLADKISINDVLPKEISRVIDDEGHIKDGASQELGRIRQSLRQRQQQLRKSLDAIFRQAVKDGYVPDGASITVRDGRMVIPVMAEYKRRIRGFVHDESATGQTVYLEPADVLESNNAIKELLYEEKREIVRILTRLTDRIREVLPELREAYHWMGLMDFIRAKARLAKEIEASFPTLSDAPETILTNARHPLLFINYKGTEKKVIPLSVRLDDDQRLVVISGPNAGGKSVCLKTVGLLQFMWQCGLLIPADESSRLGIYENMFIDIGDEQSIENDLSTYSSHLTFMKHFLAHADHSSMILIDEFGTGTDPLFGGAIAESILDHFVDSHARGVVTTHYSNIKKYAEKTSGVVNGAMKYDVQALEPLYILQIGKPGSSFSFEVARKIGLPAPVIDQAQALLGSEQMNAEELIVRLEKREQKIHELEEKMKRNEREADILKRKYETLYTELEAGKKDILKKAKNEAADLLQKTNREIEKTIRHIKENKAEKTETRRMRDRLEDLKKQVEVPSPNKTVAVSNQELQAGDQVRLIGQDVVGEVLDIRGKDIEVQIGGLKTVVKKNRLEKISNTARKKMERKPGRIISGNIDLNSRLADFSSTLDVRGMRGENALQTVERFLDDSLIFGMSEVRILHGKGDGILRTIIREFLKRHSHVANFRDEHVERGGAGMTLVDLK
jgi:DNA mismatch repair protein MutS2